MPQFLILFNRKMSDNQDSPALKIIDTPSSRDVEETTFSSVKTTKLVCVEYPAYIKNVDQMLATMGGEKKISDTYYKGKCRLQMTYRPEDLNSHFMCADLVPCTGLLMKIKRRRKKKLTYSTPQGGESAEYEYKQEIVGVVKDQYKFQTLMDYQYLVPQPMWDYYKTIHGSELAQQNFPPFFPPPIFGRIDTCGSYDYRPNPAHKRNALISKELTDTFQSSVNENPCASRKRRQAESMAALFDNESVPQGPSQGAITILESIKGGVDDASVNTMKELFDKRPIWSKLALSYQVQLSIEKLKKVIQFYGFYWLSGPWRTMWCRMGYDPRKDPKAKIYQMIDFRIRDSKESKKNYKQLIPKRSHKNYIPRNLQSRVLPHGSSVLAASEQPTSEVLEDDQPWLFSPHKMLPSRNMMYQLCDLHDPEVQKIIHENDGMETVCDEKEGWFPQGTMARIRAQMTKTVDAYFEREKQRQKEQKEAIESSLQEEFEPTVTTNEEEDADSAEFQPISYLQMLQATEGEETENDTDYYQDNYANYDNYSNYEEYSEYYEE